MQFLSDCSSTFPLAGLNLQLVDYLSIRQCYYVYICTCEAKPFVAVMGFIDMRPLYPLKFLFHTRPGYIRFEELRSFDSDKDIIVQVL